MDVLVAGERAELLDPRLHVVPGDPLARGDRLEVDLVDDVLVGLDHAVGHVDAEVALRLQHRDPQPPLEHDLVLRRPDRGQVGAGVAGGQHVGDGHGAIVPLVPGEIPADRRDPKSAPGLTTAAGLATRGGDVGAVLRALELDPRPPRTPPRGRPPGRRRWRPPRAPGRPPSPARRRRAVPAWMTCTLVERLGLLDAGDHVARRGRLRVAGAGEHHAHRGARPPRRRRHVAQGAGRGAEQQRRQRRLEQRQQRLGLGVAEAGVELDDPGAASRSARGRRTAGRRTACRAGPSRRRSAGARSPAPRRPGRAAPTAAACRRPCRRCWGPRRRRRSA